MPTITMTREDLIAKLEANRAAIKRDDAQKLKAHRAKQDAAFKAWKKRLKELAAMTYEDVQKEAEGKRRWSMDLVAPVDDDCPISQEKQLDIELAALALTNQKSFTLSSVNTKGTSNYKLYSLVMFGVRETDLCRG